MLDSDEEGRENCSIGAAGSSLLHLQPFQRRLVFFAKEQQRMMSNFSKLNKKVAFLHYSSFCLDLFDPSVLESRLDACNSIGDSKKLHARLIVTGLNRNLIIISKVIKFFTISKHGNMEYAILIFKQIDEPNSYICNTMVRGFAQSDRPLEAINFYIDLLRTSFSIGPDKFTFPFLCKACAISSAAEEGRQIHGHVVRNGLESDIFVQNSLIHMYAVVGDLLSARQLFDRSLLLDSVPWNSMLDGCAKWGLLGEARQIFNEMPEKDVVSWSTVISAYSRRKCFTEAFQLFQAMQLAKVHPNEITLVTVLSVCANLAALEQGKWIHFYINRKRFELYPNLGAGLVDMYAKCGNIEIAERVFRGLSRRSVSAWNAIISGFSTNGKGRKALALFSEMQTEGLEPDSITFVAVLMACSHSGLVEEGKKLFVTMAETYRILPSIEHYGCMVDLLGRAGLLNEAMEFIEKMPIKPDVSTWGALLGACRIHSNLEMGERVGKHLVELKPQHVGFHITLASIYSAAGKWNEAVEVRKMMDCKGIKKIAGSSLIELKGSIHEFVSGDVSHPQIREIYSKLDDISRKIREAGYVADTKQLFVDIEEEEKETAISHHGEKLAIAFGLLSETSATTPIRIVKNLRVCNDCHAFSKLTSKVFQCEIVVRDRTRFHHFKNGSCSCAEYW